MVTYLVRRALLGGLTLWVISVLSFLIIQAPPGDFVSAYVTQLQASGSQVRQEEADNLRIQYGLDRPIHVQYLKWVGLILRGNFGMSMNYGQPVMEVIGDRLGLTVAVSVAALLFTWIVALPIGIYSATHQYSALDYVLTVVGFIGLAIPGFLLALLLMYFSHRLFSLNVGGLFSPEFVRAPWSLERVWDLVTHLPLPALVLGLGGTASLIRILRSNLLDELHKPYVVTARAKGLPYTRVVLKYPLRLTLNPFVSSLSQLFPYIVSGSVIVSLVLGLPTMGPLLLQSLVAQDMYLAGTIILLMGLMTVVGTLVSDILLMWIDPRIRMETRSE